MVGWMDGCRSNCIMMYNVFGGSGGAQLISFESCIVRKDYKFETKSRSGLKEVDVYPAGRVSQKTLLSCIFLKYGILVPGV